MMIIFNFITSTKTESCHNAKFVVAVGTGGCRYVNLQNHQAFWQLLVLTEVKCILCFEYQSPIAKITHIISLIFPREMQK